MGGKPTPEVEITNTNNNILNVTENINSTMGNVSENVNLSRGYSTNMNQNENSNKNISKENQNKNKKRKKGKRVLKCITTNAQSLKIKWMSSQT